MDGFSQRFLSYARATGRLHGSLRLATAERERLWKGLERFVNCGDTLEDFQALGRAFPSFWPAETENHDEKLAERGPFWNEETQEYVATEAELPAGARIQQIVKYATLGWNPCCHKLFLFYRDILRAVWSGKQFPHYAGWEGATEQFLLGLIDYNSMAIRRLRALLRSGWTPAPGPSGSIDYSRMTIDSLPGEQGSGWTRRMDPLEAIWSEILRQFPQANSDISTTIRLYWKNGDFRLTTYNDFVTAFFLLFIQNWRARICPRCEMFFVARKPKQRFCSTLCSAGSRLASKRKWWNRVGATRRKRRGKLIRNRVHRERKPK